MTALDQLDASVAIPQGLDVGPEASSSVEVIFRHVACVLEVHYQELEVSRSSTIYLKRIIIRR